MTFTQPPEQPRRLPASAWVLVAVGVVAVAVFAALALNSTRASSSAAGGIRGISVYATLPPIPALSQEPGRGDPTSYAFIDVHPDGSPVRWDPCAPVRYVTNLDLAPEGAAVDVRKAVDAVSAATGLHFVHEGEVDELATSSYGADTRSDPPVLISWVPSSATDLLDDPATLGSANTRTALVDGHRQIVSAAIAIEPARTADKLRPGMGPVSVGALVMHELAHVVGLDHVDDPTQLMAADVGHHGSFGAGDLAGLALLGGDCPAG